MSFRLGSRLVVFLYVPASMYRTLYHVVYYVGPPAARRMQGIYFAAQPQHLIKSRSARDGQQCGWRSSLRTGPHIFAKPSQLP